MPPDAQFSNRQGEVNYPGWKALHGYEMAPAKIGFSGRLRSRRQPQGSLLTGWVGPHPNAVREQFVVMNALDLQAPDRYTDAISRLQECKDSSISIPKLSRLLGVKSTTLNAKLRRQHLSVRTVGRTNFVPGVLALQLAELHKHALIGWPTLRQASAMSGVKAGTIKARCEKGQLEGHLDLTKRLRVNPAELDGIHLNPRATPPAPGEEPFGDPAETPGVQPACNGLRHETGAVCPEGAGTKEAPRSSGSGEIAERGAVIGWVPRASSPLPAPPRLEPPSASGGPRVPPDAIPANPEIIVISGKAGGLSEVGNPRNLRPVQTRHPQKEGKNLGILSYDPDQPFSISACVTGRSVEYGGYAGKIVGILDDPFSPKIQVRFADHRHPLMREVLLSVGKRRVAK